MNKTLAAFVALVLAVPFAASATELTPAGGVQAAPVQERLDTGKTATLPTPDQKAPAAVKAADTKAPASIAAPAGTAPAAPAAQPRTAAQPESDRTGNGQVEGAQADKVPVVK